MRGIKLVAMGIVLGTLLVAGGSFAAEQGNMFKGYTKSEHKAAFPMGHPATNTLNKCIWDEESALYFCQYDIIKDR